MMPVIDHAKLFVSMAALICHTALTASNRLGLRVILGDDSGGE
jgi:hypothetical protein